MSQGTVKITFVHTNNTDESENKEESITVDADLDMSVLEIAKQNDVDLEGACNGNLACSTCHVHVLDKERFNNLPKATEAEEDMLDLAFDVNDTSRLCCQLIVTKDFEGLKLRIPKGTCNI